MSARSYLSIGDVLTLLREEFPDVTISKIRFLESQGLVNPERSPSGYRKFYDDDVERLRWVLRQQRENFLPLRVIRDRLARAGNGVPADGPTTGGGPDLVDRAEGGAPARRARSGRGGEGPAARPEATRAPVAASMAATVTATRMAPEGVGNGTAIGATEHPRPSGGEVADGWPGEAGPAPGTHPVSEDPGAQRPTAGEQEPPTAGQRGAGSGRATAGDRRPEGPSVAQDAEPPAGSRPPAGEPDAPPPAHAAPGPIAQPAEHPPAHAAGGPAPATTEQTGVQGPAPSAGAPAEGAAGSGTSLTLDELCEASGLPPGEVAALEAFGLVEPVNVGGATYYDEEAVTVAKLTAELGRYGIEPRHLRVYRNAVDREVGLIEQVVMPLLRQRNPAARQRAVEAAADLTRLGERVRASLMRRELHRQLGT